MKFQARLNRPYISTGGGVAYCEVDIEPGGEHNPATRNVVLCIDVSGSMRGDEIEDAKEGASSVLADLNGNDHISIVTFGDDAETVTEPVRWDDANQEAIESQIDALSAGEWTNIEAGLEASRDAIAQMDGGETTAKRVLLLTDGNPTAGEQSVDGLASIARRMGDAGISVISAGLGPNYDEQVVRALAEHSQGRWEHIMRASEILQFFNDAVYDAGTVVESNPRLEIDLGNIEISEVFKRMPQLQPVPTDWQGDTATIHLQDLLQRRKQELVFKLHVPEGTDEERRQLASVELVSDGRTLGSDSIEVTYTTEPQKYGEEESIRAKFIEAKALDAGIDGDTAEGSRLLDAAQDTFTDPQARALLERGQTNVSQLSDAEDENARRQLKEDTSQLSDQGKWF
ncbi:vWA domain-containing protein [Halobellus rufus]|uniref:vWA domain-containing protein n=1 Tax=Halobellus rufus TaxID=1448860 RepID=UPI00067931B7|nr:VWA domain-containing protein [Halobellus rufus]